MDLREQIKELRKQMGLSTREFGLLYAVSHRTVEDWEQGRYKPRGLALRDIQKKVEKLSDSACK